MASGPDETSDTPRVVREVIADPAAGRERLAGLFDLLVSGDQSNRLHAAWSLCLVAQHCPDAVETITERLATRLAGETEAEAGGFEAELAFAYFRHSFGDVVTRTVSEVAKEAAIDDVRARAQERSGGFARSNYISGDMVSRDVGRTKVPEGNESDPRSVYQNRANEGEEPAEPKDFAELLDGRLDGSDEADAEDRLELETAAEEAAIEDITDESEFDDLTVVSPGVDGRYTTIYRTRAVRGSREEGIAVNLFRVPDADTEAFAADVIAHLENWAAIADEDSVVSLYDWAVTPTPWMATDYTIRTLYDRIETPLSEALRDALTVAKTISYAHQRGVVHAGIDPYNVVYADGFMSDRDHPLVKNFGLMDAMRQYFEPSTLLDPRYAAPEYYDRDYGDIDHATDIYQLGAVVYRLLTGHPPFDGEYNEVRRNVLEKPPVPPSEHDAEIPAELDEVIRKSMAKQKLTRYETVTQLVSDLRRAAE